VSVLLRTEKSRSGKLNNVRCFPLGSRERFIKNGPRNSFDHEPSPEKLFGRVKQTLYTSGGMQNKFQVVKGHRRR